MAIVYEEHNKLVATWISTKDRAMLQSLAHTNKVTLAAYLRAIITDAIHEENYTSQLKCTNTIPANMAVSLNK